jgi:hypothetical protein
VIEDIWANRDRDYNIRCLVRRLQRIDKEMSGDARPLFAAFGVADGDVGRYARELPGRLQRDFTGTMKLLRDPAFQDLLVRYPRPSRSFLKADAYEDHVSSMPLMRDAAGRDYKPADYLEAFQAFVRDNPAKVEAIRILLTRPKHWSTEALAELKNKLAMAPQRFTVEALEKAHRIRYDKALVDVISMVKHAAKAEEPLFTAEERVASAFGRLTSNKTFTPEQQAWLNRIREHLVANLSIDADDFENVPILQNAGGCGPRTRAGGSMTASRSTFGWAFGASAIIGSMTWILGSAIPFGYGALISDVRVSWGENGPTRDVLQKIYPVGSMMMAGFSGSVEIGFRLIADLQRALRVPDGHIWEPKAAAWHWRRRGRRIFRRSLTPAQDLGSSIILVGMSQEKNGPFFWPRCIRMRAPDFNLEIIRPLTWASIGTGTQHQNAVEYIRDFQERFHQFYMHSETNNPGGVASSVATSVASDLERAPMETVSNILQVGTVWIQEHRIQNLHRERHGAWSLNSLADPVPGELLTSWNDFSLFMQREGLDASAAAT